MSENETVSQYSFIDLSKNLAKNSFKKIEEKNLIILGDKTSGKSSIFNIFFNVSQKESYNPTCGVNYSYMRYQPSVNKKFILNLYEIGGGIKNLNLIKTIINEKNVKNNIYIITLDFSKPNLILDSLKQYLKELSQIIKESASQETLLEIIESKRMKYREPCISDLKRINIFPGEVIIVGNKYDFLEKIDM